MASVTVADIQHALELKLRAGDRGLQRNIYKSDISRPGLEMAGYFNFYPAERVQLLGKTELSFFASLGIEEKIDRMERLCSEHTPAVIVAHGMDVPKELIQQAEKVGIPVLETEVPTTRFSGMLTNFLEGKLAPMTSMHGVLVDVYGIGVLIRGKSGVGKSETALELVKRGHRLVADDLVEIREVSKNVLIGNAPKLIEHMLEIRGVGIIDIMNLFGASAVKSDKRILIVIDLELWDEDKVYDRLGLDEQKIKIMDTELTRLTVPVRPGRSLSVIIEVAAMDYRMKRLGINAAKEFSNRLDQAISEGHGEIPAEEMQ
ncbi:HPr(Ser) kinase/phosphatase [Sporosarcina pasteurii]|uniref:HPr kinase/phosphorylase n=1 Tax=Sporosarcina pasteurii TaxID=1474 RepID=A0A380CAP0_SPOPA|nr:HPr(Ser) kinase/phosphatase [Sporosarcina pasteurii]MDS9472680.1 HPr(Ser) kinase/phosphatase [Sporosarcina pasteurii]QBQ04340.1 HPr kinase/phosphorylase [Sporosarcina pasteurii]SUJ15850.1 HPr kinase/phosphorylase [Sporosarcina pasteurii]